jgi:hypothetical protein
MPALQKTCSALVLRSLTALWASSSGAQTLSIVSNDFHTAASK